jgi:hypothetical protein
MSRDRARLRDDWDDHGNRRPRRRYDEAPMRARRSSQPGYRPYRRRSVWPWLLLGCAGGVGLLVLAAAIVVLVALRSATSSGGGILAPVIGNPGKSSTFTQQSPPRPVAVRSLTAIQVHDNIGDVSISADANATAPTVAYMKKVQASNQAEANRQFDSISVQVQPADTPAGTLSINAAVPAAGGLFGDHNSSVDLAITLPAQSTSPATPTPPTLTLSMSIGNATINGFNGVLNVKNDFGNITVHQSTLSDTSRLQTGPGNIAFDGSVDTGPAADNGQARYRLTSETGNIDATLPADTRVTLDASTNAGKITTNFPISIQSSDGGASYYGPLNPGSAPGSTQAILTLSASTGNVQLNKA